MKKAPLSKRFRPPERNRVLIDGTLDAIERLAVTVTEKGRNAEPFAWIMQSRDSVRERIICNNPACFDGGFSLGDLLREIVKNRQTEFIGTSFCTGRAGDPEAPGPHPSCDTRYNLEIRILYR